MKFSYQVIICLAAVVLGYVGSGTNGRPCREVAFNTNYVVTWGDSHASFFNRQTDLRLSLDAASGSGFGSKLSYGSGFFHMRIKLPGRNTAGVVTAYYLITTGNTLHNELDFEFLGHLEGIPITLQTNVFANGNGNREERIYLWFDPSADFHTYKILWNEHQIVFYVDNIPIRVFKNCTHLGVPYPAKPLQIVGSLWDGSDWATDGGFYKVNWTYSPFLADFQGFHVGGCPLRLDTNNFGACYSSKYWWNKKKYWRLSRRQHKALQNVRHKYLKYDYCTDRVRHPVLPPECSVNSDY